MSKKVDTTDHRRVVETRTSIEPFARARIKSIIRADNSIGKIGKVTPVAVSVALRLFLQELVKASAGAESRRRVTSKQPKANIDLECSRKLTLGDLREAVKCDRRFDFLRDSLTGANLATFAAGCVRAKAKAKEAVDKEKRERARKRRRLDSSPSRGASFDGEYRAPNAGLAAAKSKALDLLLDDSDEEHSASMITAATSLAGFGDEDQNYDF
jgi:hypothetical protein